MDEQPALPHSIDAERAVEASLKVYVTRE